MRFHRIQNIIIVMIFLCFSVYTYANFPNDKNSKAYLNSDSIEIIHYDINLDIIHLSDKSIAGYAGILITPKMSNIHNIGLNLLQLNIDSIFVDGLLIGGYTYNDTLINIPLGYSLGPGDTIDLGLHYHGHPVGDPAGWGGFYFMNDSSYAFNLGVGFGADPHNYGRVWFPCHDDFICRSTYDFHIRVQDTKSVVCSGSLMSVADNGDNTKTYHWKLHDSAPTYVIGMAIGDYYPIIDTLNGINGDIPTYVYVKPSDTLKAQASFANLIPILKIYESNFGPYQWERVGYVGIPFSGGAMEHTTNIAYPFFAINGNLSYETLMAHELAHQWFGDMVTCASAEDMWLNEGWATFCESFYQEELYGEDASRDYFRNEHRKVLQFTHIEDNGYRALFGVPHDYTYGSTSYDKGASVVHTLRGYLGDSLFFETVKANMSQNAFDTISSAGLRDFITSYTGIDMSGFFDAWVFAPGFPHFSVDSFSVIPNGGAFDVEVFMRQKYKGGAGFADENRVEITFMNSSWEKISKMIEFSGQNGSQTFNIPYEPKIIMVDMNELTGDATTDHYEVIKSTGLINFPQTYSQVNVSSITDSAFVRIEHNWVAPDPLKTPNPDINRLSDYRYWKVDGIFPNGFVAKGHFYYNRTNSMVDGYLDMSLLPNISPINPSIDSLILLYRKNTADDWSVTSYIRSGSLTKGYLICDTLKRGEYTFSVGKPVFAGIDDESGKTAKKIMEVYPNPSGNYFNIVFDIDQEAILNVYGISGSLLDSINILPKQGNIKWNPVKKNIPYGTYILQLRNSSNEIVAREKIIYLK